MRPPRYTVPLGYLLPVASLAVIAVFVALAYFNGWG